MREKEAQHETLRRVIDSGRDLDENAISRVFKEDSRPDRDLKIGGIITVFAAPGLAVLGWFLSDVSNEAYRALLGVAGLVACVGAGLVIVYAYRRIFRGRQPPLAAEVDLGLEVRARIGV